jgi:hypothetical protein
MQRRTMLWPCTRSMIAAAILLLAGCGGGGSGTIASGMAVTGPPPGRAMIVFLRPALLDKAGTSTVLDISEDPPTLISIIGAGRKLSYLSEPGTRRFMVMGETADFMDAELRAGRIYYVRVAPRQSAVGERFALRPVSVGDIALATELNDCSWGDAPEKPGQWIGEHRADIEKKKAADLPGWLSGHHAVLKADTP